jgi:hypothetical protein
LYALHERMVKSTCGPSDAFGTLLAFKVDR